MAWSECIQPKSPFQFVPFIATFLFVLLKSQFGFVYDIRTGSALSKQQTLQKNLPSFSIHSAKKINIQI